MVEWLDRLKRWVKQRLGNPKGGPNPERLVKISSGLPSKGHVMAFGHFTAERNLDVLVLNEAKNQVYVYLWDRKQGKYVQGLNSMMIGGTEDIINVIPSDFNHDGLMDVLIMSVPTSQDQRTLQGITNTLFLNDGSRLVPSGWDIPSSLGQLTPIDFQGSMQVDLLGNLSKGTGKLEVLTANSRGADESSSGYKRVGFDPELECDASGWNAFADVNGDGRPDIILTCSKPDSVELVVLLGTNSGYSTAWRLTLPKSASQFTLADVDADGSPDIIFTTCNSPGDCDLNILYNGQLPFCKDGSSSNFKCKANNVHFHGDDKAGFQVNGDRHQKIPLLETLKGKILLREDPVNGQLIPLSIGDYDLDGYPDILFTVSSSAKDTSGAHAFLLQNGSCEGLSSGGCKSKGARRSFRPTFENVGALKEEKGIVQAAFADIRGKGGLSIIGNGYSGTSTKIVVLSNDAFNDAFFIRAECLNGVCPAPCSRMATGSKAAEPYCVNYHGAAFRLSFTDIDGSARVRSGSQLAQTGNRALQMPFVIFGLGRTNSFVDLFSAGVSSRSAPSTSTHSHLIPNSDLIVIPPHADSPTGWTFQIHIHPASHFIWVTVALATALLILASLTGFFKVKERREDEAEKRKRAHAINFDAM